MLQKKNRNETQWGKSVQKKWNKKENNSAIICLDTLFMTLPHHAFTTHNHERYHTINSISSHFKTLTTTFFQSKVIREEEARKKNKRGQDKYIFKCGNGKNEEIK